MHKRNLVFVFEQRLAKLGCPAAQVRRSAREIGDHFDDLKAYAQAEGLTETQAESRAAERIGQPGALADRMAATMRKSSWWGRHPIIGFCLLPSLGMFLLLTSVPFVLLMALKGALPENLWHSIADGGTGYGVLTLLLEISFYGALLLWVITICLQARRAVVGLRWTLAACAICSLHGAFINLWVNPHSLFVGYLTKPNWFCASIPLVCWMAVLARQKRLMRSFVASALLASFFLTPAAHGEEKPSLERGWIGGEYKVARPWCVRQFLFPPPEVSYDRDFPKSLPCSQKSAIKVTDIGSNTPAALSGLRKGDLILRVDGVPVTRLADFQDRIDDCKPGHSISLTVFREGKTSEVQVLAGKENYRAESAIWLCLPTVVHGWRLIPDAGMSVVFAGWEPPSGTRYELGPRKTVFDPSWKIWLGIFEVSSGKTVVSETTANPPATSPKPAMASL